MSATGPTVVVTGASRGLGRGCALAFGAQGARLVLLARNIAELESVAAEVRASGGQARAIACDVTRVEEVQPRQPRVSLLARAS